MFGSTGKNGSRYFGRLAGYEDVNDAERLCHNPAMRWVVGGGAPMGRAASTNQMGRFETQWLALPENLAALADLPGQWIDTVQRRRPPKTIGDLQWCALRSGNVHSAAGWRDVLEPVVARYRGKRLCFRGDAAFANPEVYEFLEVEGYGYAIRLPANPLLQGKIGYLLSRHIGRPPHEVRRSFASFSLQAQRADPGRELASGSE